MYPNIILFYTTELRKIPSRGSKSSLFLHAITDKNLLHEGDSKTSNNEKRFPCSC